MIPIVYHPRYNITAFGLERLHPFDGRKYRRIQDALVARGLRRPRDFVRPRPAIRSDLLNVHAEDYLRSLRRPDDLTGIPEVPVVRRLPAWVIGTVRPQRRRGAPSSRRRAVRSACQRNRHLGRRTGRVAIVAGPQRDEGEAAWRGGPGIVTCWNYELTPPPKILTSGDGALSTRCSAPGVLRSYWKPITKTQKKRNIFGKQLPKRQEDKPSMVVAFGEAAGLRIGAVERRLTLRSCPQPRPRGSQRFPPEGRPDRRPRWRWRPGACSAHLPSPVPGR